jgi:hypothetical protein
MPLPPAFLAPLAGSSSPAVQHAPWSWTWSSARRRRSVRAAYELLSHLVAGGVSFKIQKLFFLKKYSR